MAVQGTYVHLGQRLYLNPADVSRSLRSPADGPPAGAAARWGKQVGVPPSVWAIILRHLPTSCHLLPPLVSTHAVHESPQVLLGNICGSAFGLQVAPLLAVLKGLFLNQVYVVSPPCSDMLAFSSAADRSDQM